MKYVVKNRKTGEETLCEKVEVGGWFYYIAGKAIEGDYGYLNFQGGDIKIIGKYFADDWLKVIATNNKSLDLPMVIDEVEVITEQLCIKKGSENNTIDLNAYAGGVINGYNKAKETYQYTVHDLMSFNEWFLQNEKLSSSYNDLIDLWQEQRTKTIIVE